MPKILASAEATTTAQEPSSSGAERRAGALAVAFQDGIALQRAAQYRLDGIDVVRIGRGREIRSASGELTLSLADPFVSSPHARLVRSGSHWLVEDEGSKNGTFLDGEPVTERTELDDGAVLEIGHSFLVYRASVPVQPEPIAGPEWGTVHARFAEQLRRLEQLAPTKVPIMLLGATGTGKELIAQTVHRLSGRPGAFQAVNCAALPATLVESEFFGYRRGAFSGAFEDRPGQIRSAHEGTLFLDEIGDLALPAQGVLLRALQQSEVLPVGATRTVPVDFRLIIATHRNLEEMTASGAFRSDLLARISGYTVSLPGLEERLEDLGTVVSALLRRHAGPRADRVRFTLRAARALFAHDWPLNVRELEKWLTVALPLAPTGTIDLEHLPAEAATHIPQPEPPKHLSADEERQKQQIIQLLQANQGNVTAVARMLGKARTQVQRWLKRYGIRPSGFR